MRLLQVEEVVKDGPAYLSGKVQPADIVTAVDSVRVGRKHGYGLDNVKKLILGLPDTSVTLRLVRSNQEFDAILTRAHPRTSTTILPLGAAKAPAHVVSSQLSAPANSVGALKQAGEQHDVQRCGGRFTVQTEYQVGTRLLGTLVNDSASFGTATCLLVLIPKTWQEPSLLVTRELMISSCTGEDGARNDPPAGPNSGGGPQAPHGMVGGDEE